MSEEKESGTVEISNKDAAEMLEKISNIYVMDHYRDKYTQRLEEINKVDDEEIKVEHMKILLAEMVFNFHINESIRMLVEAKEAAKK